MSTGTRTRLERARLVLTAGGAAVAVAVLLRATGVDVPWPSMSFGGSHGPERVVAQPLAEAVPAALRRNSAAPRRGRGGEDAERDPSRPSPARTGPTPRRGSESPSGRPAPNVETAGRSRRPREAQAPGAAPVSGSDTPASPTTEPPTPADNPPVEPPPVPELPVPELPKPELPNPELPTPALPVPAPQLPPVEVPKLP